MKESVKVGGVATAELSVFTFCHKVVGLIQHGCYASYKVPYLQVECRPRPMRACYWGSVSYDCLPTEREELRANEMRVLTRS
jgi:hypothetical protein